MWHIELVKNKYESLEDLYSLLQYVFRLNKTADDSRRANIITDDLTGCLPAMIPDINNPDMVYRLMLFIIQRRHKDTPQLVRHRIVSFQASDCILPQDLIPLAQSIASSYVAKGFIAAYGIHADTYCVHIHADLTDDIINDIHVYHNRLGAVVTDIAQLEQEEYEKQKRAIEATNTTQIKKLYTIKQKLENAKTHAEFDKLLQEISAVDAEIDHDNLTSEQKTHYDQLNKSCTDTISAKMRQLEYKDNIDYNKKAVNAYNSAFTSFKNNESRYKDKSQLFGLVSTTLFAYDAGRLFNETLIFYNHVYSYIFSKLDDNGKLELTRYSIECERKLR